MPKRAQTKTNVPEGTTSILTVQNSCKNFRSKFEKKSGEMMANKYLVWENTWRLSQLVYQQKRRRKKHVLATGTDYRRQRNRWRFCTENCRWWVIWHNGAGQALAIADQSDYLCTRRQTSQRTQSWCCKRWLIRVPVSRGVLVIVPQDRWTLWRIELPLLASPSCRLCPQKVFAMPMVALSDDGRE